MRKRLIAIAAVLACYTAGSAVVLDLASATQQERLTIAEGQTLRTAYDPIPGSDPARSTAKSEAGEPPISPDECNQVPATCDVIPITVLAPANPGEKFLIRVSLFWEAQPTPGTSLASSDLDMYLWSDPPGDQTVTFKDDDDTTNDQPGASGRIPERIQLFTTTPGDHLLVVNNFLGSNDGHELELIYFSGDLVAPFESLDPTFAAPVDRSATPSNPPPAANSGPNGDGDATSGTDGIAPASLPNAGAPDDAPPPPTTRPLALGDVEGTSTFDDIDGLGHQALAAPPRTVPLRATQISAPHDVSAAVLLLWFGLVPLSALGCGAILLRRNHTDVFATARTAASSTT